MKTIIDLFLQQVEKNGSRTAVMDRYGAWTYRELNQRSALLAQRIPEDCRGKGERVAILLPRSRDYLAALLAVIRAGCAAVPLDSEYPKERISSILQDAECRRIITTEEFAGKAKGPEKILTEESWSDSKEMGDLTLNLSRGDLDGLLVYTSGSTGKPKGVIHAQSIFSHFYETYSLAGRPMSEERVHLCIAGFTFIAAEMNLTTPIMKGASVYIADEKERVNADQLWNIIKKRHVTSMFCPPKLFNVMRELFGRLPLSYVEQAGEKADTRYANDGNLYEAYGASETFTVLHHQIAQGDGRSLGKPVPGVRVFLINDEGNKIEKPGEIGELCVISPWLAKGYSNLPEETAARFTDCPFEPGTRMYRTGDYFSLDEEGNYLFRGRKDRMVKLRGFRIELGEIENVLYRAGSVKEAACITVKVNGGDKLCCYYTGDEKDAKELKDLVSASLPSYMVPDYFIHLEAMPRNDRSKINYLALREMELPIEEEYTEPETEDEQAVCNAFARALEMSRVSVNADFFDLGGTSLSVAVLIAALEGRREGLSFQDVVSHPTPRALAAFLNEEADEDLDMERDFYPLTKTQMGIYLEGMTGGNATTYSSPFLVRIDPSVTAEELITALKKVITAHPSMKYVIRVGADKRPYMFMAPEMKVDIPIVDGSSEGRLEFMKEFVPVVPLMDHLLFHFAVYRTPEGCYLACKTHLIFLDGSTINLLLDELNRALKGEELLGEKYTIQMAGVWEEKKMQDGSHTAAKDYYADLFKNMDDIPALAGDLEGPLTPGVSENLRCEQKTLSVERVRAFCEKNQITESTFFLGAMAIMLGKYLNSKHVSFSTVYNGRARAGMDNTVGTLIKRIPVYGDLSKDMPVGDFLRGISRQIFSNMSHDIYSFDEVLRECPVNEDVEFIYQGSQFTEHAGDGKVLAEGDKWFFEHYHTGMVTGSFSIQCFSTGGLYNLTVEYRNERYSEGWVRSFAGHLFAIAEELLEKENIAQVDMLTAKEHEQLVKFNDTAVKTDFMTVHEQIHRHALDHPERKAVTAAGKTLTFGELDCLSNQLAAALRESGVKKETLVGVLFDREVWAYVAEIGILKAGGAFVPFIPDYPDERIDFCMKDGSIPMLLTTEELRKSRGALNGNPYKMVTIEELFGAKKDDIRADEACREMPEPGVGPDNLAYCIYTSGTTGRPKGVMIEHHNIANYVHRNEKSLEIMHYAAPGRVCLAMASFSFDVSVVEEFVPLCNGNPVVIAAEEEIHTPSALAELIRKNGVNGITGTPTYLLSLLDIPDSREALRQISFYDIGAEAFPAQLYDRLRELRQDSVILNVYGPTEATMGCSAEEMKSNELVTVGPPIANTCFYISDPFGNEMPVGIRGELIICGEQVGRGYINLPDKTAASFFTHKGMRAYHSGDLASWTEDGKIRIFGRVDNQIKLRGFRIELDEIEKVMTGYPGVKTGAAAVKKNGGTEYLVGYYTAQSPIEPDVIRAQMHEKLPEYMVPSVLIQLDVMPMTSSGKVDKRALPEPDFSAFRAEYKAPETETEKRICAAFAAALKQEEDKVSILDDFFELGGDSLKAMSALAEADMDGLTAADFFQKRTPQAIAAAVDARVGLGSIEEQEEAARKVPHPLTPLQMQMMDIQLYRPGATMWSNTHFLVHFDPENVDAQRLCDAVNKALQNHPALSSAFRFNEDFELVQEYIPGLLPELKVQEITEKTAEMLSDVLVMPYNKVLNSCLCRAGVYRSPKYTWLFMDIHHMVLDGPSLGVLLQDVTNAFYGRELSHDYYYSILAEEEKRIAEGSREQDHAWFMKRYGDDVWCNMPEVTGDNSNIKQAEIANRLSFNVDDVAKAEKYWGVSHSVMAIASGLKALSLFTGKQHVMVNWIYNNRLSPIAEGAVGMLIKNLPCAARMEELPRMRDLLRSVQEQVTEGIAHCTYDFMQSHYQAFLNDCAEVNLQIGINGSPLDELDYTEVELKNDFLAAGARLEMELVVNEQDDGGFDFDLDYAEGLFSEEYIRGMNDLYIKILEGLIYIKNPEELSTTSES